mgnify:CR=1 FL=1
MPNFYPFTAESPMWPKLTSLNPILPCKQNLKSSTLTHIISFQNDPKFNLMTHPKLTLFKVIFTYTQTLTSIQNIQLEAMIQFSSDQQKQLELVKHWSLRHITSCDAEIIHHSECQKKNW